MKRVVIGVDPHKPIEIVDQRENLLGAARFTTDKAGFAAMRKYVNHGRRLPGRPLVVVEHLLEQRLCLAGRGPRDVPAPGGRDVRDLPRCQDRNSHAGGSPTSGAAVCDCSPATLRNGFGLAGQTVPAGGSAPVSR